METIQQFKYSMSVTRLEDMPKSSCIYVSGRMSGLPDLGKSKLDEAELSLSNMGFINTLNPYRMVDQSKNLKWSECMAIDFKDIFNYGVRACCLVDNWRGSKGAVLEVIMFLALGIPLYDMHGVNITVDVYNSFDPKFIYDMFVQMVGTHIIND